jgi:Tfp pilus assembly protein PilP
MKRPRRIAVLGPILGGVLGGVPASAGSMACGDEPVASQRGVPGGTSKAKAQTKTGKTGKAAAEQEGAQPEVRPEPPRPPVALDAKAFSRRRDPFQVYVAPQAVVAEPDKVRAERKVKMGKYAFEDLRLVAIVNSGRGVVPRALFLASDGKSKTIRQGEYFSSAEVLLAAVNRDYVEIEVVDDDLASSLNLQRGERRALYLRTD